jgi:hypothetical protein
MALTQLQHDICRIITGRLKKSGESYVAGGVALNLMLEAPRISRDIDLFHDTTEAVESAWVEDQALLKGANLEVIPLRDVVGFKEALVRGDVGEVLVQWIRDSAFRFFPLVESEILGLTLHPFDLATNKVLALVGRLEPRDWIDVLESDEKIQPLGYLAWAACAKDPGFSPRSILSEAKRSGRYSQAELNELSFLGPPPHAGELGQKWHRILDEAARLIEALVDCEIGTCVLDHSGGLCRLPAKELKEAVRRNRLRFRSGSIRGVLPVIRQGTFSSERRVAKNSE